MNRIRYSKQADGSLKSTSLFKTVGGLNVAVYLKDTTFVLADENTGAPVQEGSSTNPVVLRRLAKNALLALLDNTQFVKEVRKERTKSL
jgi:hypothetical protein